jgi:4-aminobutyrate aminotransferase/(S)-3-amino-2-methylpropionate transaminase
MSYRQPFADHLIKQVTWVPYPTRLEELDLCLSRAREVLRSSEVGALIVEPILGRGGVIVPPVGFLNALGELCREFGTCLISDEIWTGLGRSGEWLMGDLEERFLPDVICVGKGLGGGLPISACIGTKEVMSHWSRTEEVVHTSTFAGAPLACTAALSTLGELSRKNWVRQARDVGNAWIQQLRKLLADTPVAEIRGRGFMIGIDASHIPGGGVALQQALLERGFITTTGGGTRDVLVLTPPLNISQDLLMAFEDSLRICVMMLCGR